MAGTSSLPQAKTRPSGDFTLESLRGGLNNSDPAMALDDDQCTIANNVEFWKSTLGERRAGCTKITLPTEFASVNLQAVTFLYRHLPSTDETGAQLWAMAQHLTTQNYSLQYKDTAWHSIVPADAIDVTANRGTQVQAQTFHGKLFFAYKSVSSVDRLHVWDGTNLRRTGVATPLAPTAADTGVGTYTGVRYGRVRYTVQSGGVTLRRSEPSVALAFTPSGTGTGSIWTKPATISESETHWELELSIDNANFYRVATTVVGTATVTDSVDRDTGYATTGTLSETSGDYTLQPSCKFLTVDQDRLLMAGSWENTALGSRVSWTPVYNDPGKGNDERIPIVSTNYRDLDTSEGGDITGMSNPVNGFVHIFKWACIYKMVRTNTRLNAYEVYPISKSRGALPGSIVEGSDVSGRVCLYFLDPKMGPSQLGVNGLQLCGADIKTTMETVNVNAKVVSRVLYYPTKQQVHWWVATGSSNYPDTKIVLQTSAMREGSRSVDGVASSGLRGGWSTADNRSSKALATCLFAANIDAGVARSLELVPFIALAEWTVAAATIQDFIQRCDTGDSDADATGDTTSHYRGRIVTKPYTPAGILNRFGIRNAALLATANATANVVVRGIRDFGVETLELTVPLAATGSETHVIKVMDEFSFSELKVLQMEFGDLDTDVTPSGTWELHQFAAKPRREETS